jgi:hypothetical protein
MAKTPEETTESMIQNLREKTGKSLEQWIALARASRLKSEHGLTHGYANLVALRTLQGGAEPASGEDLVAAQYAGAKAPLRAIYDALIAAAEKLGRDVEIAPKKTYVSLRRSKQFALIQPSTASRLDVGINLKGTLAGKRLEASGSFNAMVSHRVRLASKRDVDQELIGWLRSAYAQA